MNINDEYRKLFETDFDELRRARRDAYQSARDAFDKEVLAARKRLKLPRKSRLPDADAEAISTHLRNRFRIDDLDGELDRACKARDARLAELAPSVVPARDPSAFWKIKTSFTSSYESQTQPATYARGELYPLARKIEARGIPTAIVERTTPIDIGCGPLPVTKSYELWAQCPLWMADAIQRTLTIRDALRAYNQAGVNARVYWPFLSHDIDQWTAEYGWGSEGPPGPPVVTTSWKGSPIG